MESKSSKFAWASVALYALLIFTLSAIPGKNIPRIFPISDKVLHFFEYLPFGWFLVNALSKTISRNRFQTLLLSCFVVMLYALSDEVHQIFVAGRQFDLLDMLSDIIGAMIGGLFFPWPK